MKRINNSTLDMIMTRDGRVIMTQHWTVRGKTMRGDYKGVDAQGKPVQGFELWDKQ
jgi:hypothetical protein